ncbi:MAG: IclR family transcriptional regulator [Sulfobacillus thermotolerans]|uniref:IclR family transcriptional regulator n=1 Tax=Sulfobacillus thermotolerans TaxID=338644 RepID=A0ABM6RST4_9FIRM|nr:hypothetical protein BXT84_11080 [Sulfobacillus thermotolerans]MCY0907557.1 IclR family transcriptional regulator [Sulfobacillus thermotolerans]
MQTEENSSILVLTKIGQVLDYLSVNREAMSVSEMSRQLNIVRPTLHRILDSLVAEGILSRRQGQYIPGWRLAQWGARALKAQSLTDVGQEVLEHLVERARETASIYVRVRAIRICSVRVEGPGLLRHSISVGEPLPLHAGSSGYILLAWLEESERKRLWSESIRFFGGSELFQWPSEETWQQIRRDGFAVSLGQRDSALASVSVPVWGQDHQVKASLALSGPISRFSPETLPVMVQYLLKAARAIESQWDESLA